MTTEKRYAVRTRFVFDGLFLVNAVNVVQAREYVENHCGLVLGGNIHSTLSEEAVDWDFPVHPEKHVGKAVSKSVDMGDSGNIGGKRKKPSRR